MQINHLTRAYRYDGIDLPVPVHLANDREGLRAYHATLYPAILNAEMVDAGVSGTAHVTEYRRAVGTKG
ncbi:MAG: PRTRC system protein C [Pseudomonadota bacterium]|uniref:PRTRC system protein C n=1 Tax=Novosphingobium sp. CCH12-A3 TaxID=1768752 RepID=UPI000781B230|nr:PRTRC system protein C [Novosphingobium sp. CCH12-A3]